MKISRRMFSALVPAMAMAQTAPVQLDLVKDFVGKAHQRKLDPMKELLKREPALILASSDWGAGDWENALQAAAHTGSREMALFLLDQGARLDLFAASMLGELSVLKVAVEAFPGTLKVRGAHGIPLLSHAVAGEVPALPVFEYLLAKGADVNAEHRNGMTALMIAVQTGQRETVKRLLAKGANPNAKATNGNTPLGLSIKAGTAEITADLKAAGAE